MPGSIHVGDPVPRPRLVVVGHGMVGHRLLQELVEHGAHERWSVTVFGEEPHAAYDRVRLSSVVDGTPASELCLVAPDFAASHGIEVVAGDPVVAVDRARQRVRTVAGIECRYDHLVLATGSAPFVPPVPGVDRPGVFVYRTLDDLAAIRAHAARPEVTVGVVVGGGLLGLEAANALRLLGLRTHVVEMAPRLMPVQLDDDAAAVLRREVEELGIGVHTGARTTALVAARGDGAGEPVGRVELEVGAPLDHGGLECQLVVFSAGIRPRDELARACGLPVAERGGVEVDGWLATADPAVSAVGEVASIDGRCLGLVAPGYEMARVLARRLAAAVGLAPAATDGTAGPFVTPDLSTKLKLLGVEVASFGDAFAVTGTGTEVLTWSDSAVGIHKRLVRSADGRLLGGMLVGDAADYQQLRLMALGEIETPADLASWVAPSTGPRDTGALPDGAGVCSCENVCAGQLRAAVDEGAHTLAELKGATGAGSGCAGCVPMMASLLRDELRARGHQVSDALCDHFPMSRRALFDLIRIHGHASWREVLAAHGIGGGCEICRPTVASILASRSSRYVLDGDQAALQDTNDHLLANLQRDGTYSVVPRVPGGEITPDQLMALGRIAKDYGLYTKITGGQRIDLLGARLEDLPAIWADVLAAGLESGHAYGKAVRTVKSCVGRTWCRYGVQDSVAMAVRLELRYRGLRAPHKLKLAVSGCARECAEAQSKDVGVIATDRGWSLYVAGNGGKTPRHADLLATDLDDEELIRAIDRFLAYYIRTADRLQRTAAWFEELDRSASGHGLDHLRGVVFDDALGVTADLDAEIAGHVDAYECEWSATLADPRRLARFQPFVNAGAGAGTGTSTGSTSPLAVCSLAELEPERGAAAIVGDRQVALFRLPDDTVRVVDHRDPATGVDVLARGLLGTVTAADGSLEWYVASPLHKQRYSLTDGRCLDDESLRVDVHDVAVDGGTVWVAVGERS